MDYDGRETLGICAAGALGAGVGMLAYKHKKEIGLYCAKVVALLEVISVSKLKDWANKENTGSGEKREGGQAG